MNNGSFNLIMPTFDEPKVEAEGALEASMENIEIAVKKPEVTITAEALTEDDSTMFEHLDIMNGTGDDIPKPNPVNSIFVFRTSSNDKTIKRVDVHITHPDYRVEQLFSVLRQLPKGTPVHVFMVTTLRRTKASAIATAILETEAEVTVHLIKTGSPTMLEAAFSASRVVIGDTTVIQLSHDDEMIAGAATDSVRSSCELMEEMNELSINTLVKRNVLTEEEAEQYKSGAGLYLDYNVLLAREENFIVGPIEDEDEDDDED